MALLIILKKGIKSGDQELKAGIEYHRLMYRAISKKVVVVNSRYWNLKELWDSSSTNNLLLLALTLQNMECRFIIIPRQYSDSLRWRIITLYYDCTESSFRFQYRLLTITTFFDIAVCYCMEVSNSTCIYKRLFC